MRKVKDFCHTTALEIRDRKPLKLSYSIGLTKKNISPKINEIFENKLHNDDRDKTGIE